MTAAAPASLGHAAVAIIGAGPSGLAAATELARRHVGRVVVIDREAAAGGIPRHCGHYPFGLREFHRLMKGPAYASRLAATADAAGAEILTGTNVVSIEEGPALLVTRDTGLARLTADRLLIATGVREKSRAGRFIGGTKPGGVIATGALQAMVYLEGTMPFRRPVIIGSELVSFSAIMTCRHAGIAPQAMIEAGTRPVAFAAARAFPALFGIPFLARTRLVRILGGAHVEAVEVEGPDGRRMIETDGVIVSGGFMPEATLVHASHLEVDPASGGPVIDEDFRTTDPAIFASGNLLRPVETAGWSWKEGRQAGAVIAADLARGGPQAPDNIAVGIDHPALKFVLPQRIGISAKGAREAGMTDFQLRLTRPVKGRIIARSGADEIWSRALSSRPERRILVPIDDVRARVPAGPATSLTFSIVEG